MLALLLARYGVQVRILEKHDDFLRDFRGDTIHPSTMQNLHELGLLAAFLELPHQRVERVGGRFAGESFVLADLRHLPLEAPYIAMLPQWEFLNFLRSQAEKYSAYRLDMGTAATDLLWEQGRVAGVRAQGPTGSFDVRAELVVAADGRNSVMRESAGLKVQELGAPIDVLWFRLPRDPHDGCETMALFDCGHILIVIDRGDYWQVAFVIPKGGFEALKTEGLPAFLQRVAGSLPFGKERVSSLASWDAIKLLRVQVDRLETWWRSGFLAIGDAAHAMSPIGGVGINLAIQDAVATANLLAPLLREGACLDGDLAAVQARRAPPTERTQRLQLQLQDRVIEKTLSGQVRRMPLALKLLQYLPVLRRFPAQVIGAGFQPEHISNELRYV